MEMDPGDQSIHLHHLIINQGRLSDSACDSDDRSFT